jgi:hypothetical protein
MVVVLTLVLVVVGCGEAGVYDTLAEGRRRLG